VNRETFERRKLPLKRRVPRPNIPGDASRTILKRTAVLMILFGVLVFIPLIWKLFDLQIVQYDTLSQMAADNQTRTSSVTPARGTIYDRNMNILAVSADVENVCIDPNELGLSGQDLSEIARNLSEMLEVDQAKIESLMEDTSYRYQIIKRKVEQEEAALVRAYISENAVTGVYLEPDTKRYYPCGALAAQVLGFVGSDNTGLDGIEAACDDTLSGLSGEITTAKGNYGANMTYYYEAYEDAVSGNDVVLTIDETVQEILEKHMQEAITQYEVENGAFGVVMDVNTGEILAMATLGSYDPNNYAVIYDADTAEALEEQYQEAMEAEGELQEELLSAYNTAVANARLTQWRNRVISDGYEPGSTFKSITLASALEEGAVTLSDSFYCSGSTTIRGRTKALHCWRSAGHGQQSTAEALQNSCNVAFANIGIRLGGEKLYEYVHKFGLTEKTGIELGGEASGIFFDEETLANPDSYASLASAAFGQTFKITPLQLVRAISAVVNGGYLLEPYIVKAVLSPEGELIQESQRTVLRQVISEETSKTMCTLLESVVSQGTAKNAQIAGYRIGGKTGTSEKIDVFDENGNPVEDKIVSFVGIAPMDDPQYIVLVALDTPSTTSGYYISGGQMGAPTVRDVLADMLPYLGIEPEYSQEEETLADVSMPDLDGMTLSEAKTALQEKNLTCRTVGTGETVTDQLPASGATIPGGSEVVLYLGEEPQETSVTVPNVLGKDAETANKLLTEAGLYLKIIGATGTDSTILAVSQSPGAGETVEPYTVVEVEFSDLSAQD
jgi:stage V sporulation protein D (sporulation-specific penicillin-binding protein)